MNKDIEFYGLVPDGENAWCVVDENEDDKSIISNADIEKVCEHICNKDCIKEYGAEGFVERVWEEFRDNYCPGIEDYIYTENWDKFIAWFDYICVDYLTKEIVGFYKQRLLDFE